MRDRLLGRAGGVGPARSAAVVQSVPEAGERGLAARPAPLSGWAGCGVPRPPSLRTGPGPLRALRGGRAARADGVLVAAQRGRVGRGRLLPAAGRRGDVAAATAAPRARVADAA